MRAIAALALLIALAAPSFGQDGGGDLESLSIEIPKLPVGADPSLASTIRAWTRRAEGGDVDAQYWLGIAYGRAVGVPQDDVGALSWYRMAAEAGHTGAQYQVGLMFHNGAGVDRDFERAAYWFRQAADQGSTSAQHDIAILYFNGRGVPQSRSKNLRFSTRGWRCQTPEHDADHGETDEGDNGSGITLEVAGEAPVAADPGDGPAFRQGHEAVRVGALNDFQLQQPVVATVAAILGPW